MKRKVCYLNVCECVSAEEWTSLNQERETKKERKREKEIEKKKTKREREKEERKRESKIHNMPSPLVVNESDFWFEQVA